MALQVNFSLTAQWTAYFNVDTRGDQMILKWSPEITVILWGYDSTPVWNDTENENRVKTATKHFF